MNAEELASYQYQLDQVNTALEADPENAELNKLKQDLNDLISLTESFLQQQEQVPPPQTKPVKKPSAPPKATTSLPPKVQKISAFEIPASDHRWTIGDTCQAKWSSDKQFYEAVIVAISGDGTYSVTFKGYGNTEVVSAEELKPISNKTQKKREQTSEAVVDDPTKKKKKTTSKTSETAVKQQAWLKFANNKKGKNSTAINKKSIFATPTEPEGKVGVVGSGKGMTDFKQRGKHIYESR
ncbi:hypothetical protein K7432_005247 [Basidiobolus ranarum]|uniref:Tudor domain-containing protein n=1 Tax=Basidiobolus ranarum TaxID=34480 RepID=A0ABR2WWY3_9FUNG